MVDLKKTFNKNSTKGIADPRQCLRLSINPRTAKTQFFQIIEIDLEVAFFISFGEPRIGSPKAFLLTSSKAAYRTFVRLRRLFPRLRVFLEV